MEGELFREVLNWGYFWQNGNTGIYVLDFGIGYAARFVLVQEHIKQELDVT